MTCYYYSTLTITILLVTISFALTITNMIHEENTTEQWITTALFICSYIVPAINKELHIITTVALIAMLGRLSTQNDALSVAALILYATASSVGHLIGKMYKFHRQSARCIHFILRL